MRVGLGPIAVYVVLFSTVIHSCRLVEIDDAKSSLSDMEFQRACPSRCPFYRYVLKLLVLDLIDRIGALSHASSGGVQTADQDRSRGVTQVNTSIGEC